MNAYGQVDFGSQRSIKRQSIDNHLPGLHYKKVLIDLGNNRYTEITERLRQQDQAVIGMMMASLLAIAVLVELVGGLELVGKRKTIKSHPKSLAC